MRADEIDALIESELEGEERGVSSFEVGASDTEVESGGIIDVIDGVEVVALASEEVFGARGCDGGSCEDMGGVGGFDVVVLCGESPGQLSIGVSESEVCFGIPELIDALADEQACGFFGVFLDDVDDAVERVGSPCGAARASDGFDLLDVIEEEWDSLEVHPAVDGVADVPSVEEEECSVGEGLVEASDADSPAVFVEFEGVDSWDVCEEFWEFSDAGVSDVVGVEDTDGDRGHVAGLLGARGADDDVEVFKEQVE